MEIKKWLHSNEEDLKKNFEEIKETFNGKEFLNVNSPEDLLLLRDFIINQFDAGYLNPSDTKLLFFSPSMRAMHSIKNWG